MLISDFFPILLFLGTISYIFYIVNKGIYGNNKNSKGKKLNDKVIFIYNRLSDGPAYYYIKDSISYSEGDDIMFNPSAIFEFYGCKYNNHKKSFEAVTKHHFNCRKIDVKKAYNIEEFKHLTSCK